MNIERIKETIKDSRFCPMTHDSDIVTNVLRSETYSPRGRGMILYGIQAGKIQWNDDVAEVMYKFACDGLVNYVNSQDTRHDEMIIWARQQLIEKDLAPQAVKNFLNPAENSYGWDKITMPNSSREAEFILFFGEEYRFYDYLFNTITSLVKEPFSCLDKELPTGIYHYELGAISKGEELARKLEEKIQGLGLKKIVVASPEAYRAFKVGFGNYKGLQGFEVVHITEYLAEKGISKDASNVAYHDTPSLARFAPCMDAPRKLLKNNLELMYNRSLSWGAGETGGLPMLHHNIAIDCAKNIIKQAQVAGANILVSAHPWAVELLKKASQGNIEVKEICEYLNS